MFKCDLQKEGKCTCKTKCAKLIWYEKGRTDAYTEIRETLAMLVTSEVIDYLAYEQILKQIGVKE